MTRSLEILTDLPDSAHQSGAVDLFSQVLGQITLTGDRVFARTPMAGGQLDLVAEASHLCIVAQGRMEVGSEDRASIMLEAGDLVLLTGGGGEPRLTALSQGTSLLIGRFSFATKSLLGMAF